MNHNVFWVAALLPALLPALMTRCRADRSSDFGALTRKGKEWVAARVAGVAHRGSTRAGLFSPTSNA